MVMPRRYEDARMLLGSHTTSGDEVLGIFPRHNAPDTQMSKYRKQHVSARSAPRSRCQTMKNEDEDQAIQALKQLEDLRRTTMAHHKNPRGGAVCGTAVPPLARADR